MKLLTILAISIGLLTASQAMQKPWFHTKGTRWLDCPVMKGIILCKCGSERIFFPDTWPDHSRYRTTLDIRCCAITGLWEVNELKRFRRTTRQNYRMTIFGSAEILNGAWKFSGAHLVT